MTSRSQGLSTALRAPGRFEVRSVPPSGDCFYDALHLQLPLSDRPAALADASTMRDTVANSITGELLDKYRMYAAAGLEEFEFMRRPGAEITTLDELQAFARRRGRDAGPGSCLWAGEHAIMVVSKLAEVRVFIFDEQAAAGRCSGRRRGGDAAVPGDGRFCALGKPSARCVLLHRSRRQHFSPVFFDGQGVVEIAALPEQTRALWPAPPAELAEAGGVRDAIDVDAEEVVAPCQRGSKRDRESAVDTGVVPKAAAQGQRGSQQRENTERRSGNG